MPTLRGTAWQRPNGTWTVQGESQWDAAAGKHTRPTLGTFATEAAAREAQLQYTLSITQGTFSMGETALLHTKVADYFADWLVMLRREVDAGKIALRTFIDYDNVVRNHVIPYLGGVTLGSINRTVLRKWLLDIANTGLSERSVEKAYRTLHRALGDSELRYNPVKLPKRHRPGGRKAAPRQYPKPDTVLQFLDHLLDCPGAADSDFGVALTLAATTGLRRGEVCGLAWNDLDLDAATLTVEQTLGQGRGSHLFVKGPKSRYGYRTIGILPGTVATLRAHRKRQVEQKLKAGGDYEALPFGHNFVFRGSDIGAALTPARLTDAMTREWQHTGLEPRSTLHGLRHAVGSALLLQGLTITDVAAHLGDQPRTVAAFYQHELDSRARRRNVLDAMTSLYGTRAD